MPFVHCRECGHEIKADTKQTRCDKCGTFFPFTCAVCEKFLRPPFAVYEDERYLTDEGKPLCQDHYQRQCPECHKWFQADENPGYFLCLSCAQARQHKTVVATPAPATNAPMPSPGTPLTPRRTPMPAFDYVVFGLICTAAVVGFIFLALKLLGTGVPGG